MEVALVVGGVLAPVDGSQLEEPEPVLGRVAAEAGAATLPHDLLCARRGSGFGLLWDVDDGRLGREGRLPHPLLGSGVRLGRRGGKAQECREPAFGSLGGEGHDLLAQLAEAVRAVSVLGRHVGLVSDRGLRLWDRFGAGLGTGRRADGVVRRSERVMGLGMEREAAVVEKESRKKQINKEGLCEALLVGSFILPPDAPPSLLVPRKVFTW